MKAENNNALENLKEIRTLMERSSRFISLSGLSGIASGIIGIAGGILAIYLFRTQEITEKLIPQVILLAVLVLISAMAIAVLFTVRNAKKKGLKCWDKMSRMFLLNFLLPLALGGIFCGILLYYEIYQLIIPAMLIFYGLALFNASNFTFSVIKFLGLIEMCLGIIAAFIPEYSIYLWTTGFGLLHIIYGIFMFNKYKG